jgi:hypothetical protein
MKIHKKIIDKLVKTAVGFVFLFNASMILKAQDLTPSLTNSLLYQTDFNTSSTGYNYTTNGNGSGTVVYQTNRQGQVTQWATAASGQDGWVSSAQGANSGYGPGVIDYVLSYPPLPYFQSYGGDTYYSTELGNVKTYPQSATNYLTQSQYANAGVNNIHFDTTFNIYGDPGNPNSNDRYDTLGWTLLNSAGNPLISINLNTENPSTGWILSVSSYANNGVTNQVLKKANGTDLTPINNGSTTHLGFNVVGIGTAQQAIQILNYGANYTPGGTNYSILGTDQITGYDFSGIAGGTNIASLASTWILQNTNPNTITTNTGTNANGSTFTYTAYSDYAFNSLQMNNITISIPEPKTWILFGISGLIMVIALRRKA